ncbi:MAG TPA: polysaccharide deacetylase family protein [Candidatus Sulfotelmatobacter sp.]|jgi:peptidoglycan/xylan/chitin deacetylase (PgdA/CDA1 family)
MKDWIKKGIVASGALRLAGDMRAAGAAILMFHSVLPDPSLQVDSLGDIVHSGSEFTAQMELLARHYHPISLDDAVDCLCAGEALPKRSVVVTFDDGYADNFEVAMPVLNRLGVPAIFYVTVDCIENRKLPWPSRLRFAFRRTKVNAWDNRLGKSWMLTSPSDREAAFLHACDRCCQLSGVAQEEFVSYVERELQACLPGESSALMMTYDQVRGLIHHGHLVGSHTMTHPNMAYVKEDEAHREFTDSKQRLESQLGAPIRHFSYPCPALSPHWNDRTVQQSRALGYETGVTTKSGLTRPGDNVLCLNRLRPTKTVEGLRWNLESAFAGRTV